jgi:hypothetical protein
MRKTRNRERIKREEMLELFLKVAKDLRAKNK